MGAVEGVDRMSEATRHRLLADEHEARVALEQLELPAPKARRRSRAGAPGPSGGAPRISSSWKSRSGSSMSARSSAERSPKRR